MTASPHHLRHIFFSGNIRVLFVGGAICRLGRCDAARSRFCRLTANQNIGKVWGACSRSAFFAASNSGKIDWTVAQKRGL